MKKSNYFLIVLAIMIALITSCNLSEDLGEFNTVVSLEAIQNKKQLLFVNANSNGREVSDIKLSFSGEANDDIFSTFGKRVSKLDNNNILIGLKRGVSASNQAPKTAIMRIEAEGFITKEVPLLFNGLELENVTIPLLEKTKLPESIQLIEQEIVLENGRINSPINIKIESSSDSENILEFSLEEGTIVKDKDGNVITQNNLSVSLQTFDTNARYLENSNFNAVSEILPYVNYKEGEQLIPFSAFKINIKVNGEDVFLSKPFQVSVPNPSNENNSFSKSSLKFRNAYLIEEDFSMFVFQDDFNLSGEVIIDKNRKNRNRVVANSEDTNIDLFSGINLSSGFWVLGRSIQVCKLNLNLKNTSASTKYQVQVASALFPEILLDYELINIAHNKIYSINSSDNIFSENFTTATRQFSFQQFPVNSRLKITAKLIDGSSIVVHDQTYTDCSLNRSEIDVSLINQPSESINLDMNLECRGNSYVLSNHPVFYKRQNTLDFFLYGVIEEGRLNSLVPLLDNETTYTFIKVSGEQITIKGSDIKFLRDRIDQEDFCDIIGR